MAYNPGVQDISGQLKYQGISQGINSLAQGAMGYLKQQEENKVLLGKAKATESFIKNHPDLFGGDEKVAQLTATDPKESPAAKYERLAQIVQDQVVGEKMKANQQEAEMRGAQLRAVRAEEAQLAKLRQISQFTTPATANTGASMPGGPQLVGQGQSGPAGLGFFSQPTQAGGGVVSPQAQQNMDQQMANNPMLRVAAQAVQSTGRMPTPDNVMDYLARVQGNGRTVMPLAAVQQQYPSDKYDANMVPTGQPGMVEVKSVSPRAPVQDSYTASGAGNKVIVTNNRTGDVKNTIDADPAIPSGYERDGKGGLVPIKGGPVEAEAKQAANQAKSKVLNHLQTLDVMTSELNDIIPRIGHSTAGVGALLGSIPGTPAYDVASKIDTIKANISFQALAEMREASKTGGALGNVTARELDALEKSRGSLDRFQSPPQLKETAMKIQQSLIRVKLALQGIDPDEPNAQPQAAAPLKILSITPKK